MEAFGDYDGANLERLAAKKERTKAEDQKFRTLSQLRYIKTRTMQSRERRIRTVMDDAEKNRVVHGPRKNFEHTSTLQTA